MSGVYFVLNKTYSQCWIQSSDRCVTDANLVSAGMYQEDLITCYIKTETMEQANGVMAFIADNYSENHVNLHWYKVNPDLELGRLYQRAIDYLNSNHFCLTDGTLYVFEKYIDSPRKKLRATV